MTIKTLLATAAIAATAALGTATAAKADPHVGINFGFGFASPGFGYGLDPFWRPFRPHHPHWGWAAPRPLPVYGIGCGAGANVVRSAGYTGVSVMNCAGPVYTYEAWKRGAPFRVAVNRNGQIVQVVREF